MPPRAHDGRWIRTSAHAPRKPARVLTCAVMTWQVLALQREVAPSGSSTTSRVAYNGLYLFFPPVLLVGREAAARMPTYAAMGPRAMMTWHLLTWHLMTWQVRALCAAHDELLHDRDGSEAHTAPAASPRHPMLSPH